MMMLRSVLLCFLFLLTTRGLHAQDFGTSTSLHQWFFHLGDVPNGEKPDLDYSGWEAVRVPHDWSVAQFASPDNASCTGYLPGGIGWYRTSLDLPVTKNAKRYYLYFEGVYKNSEVWVNGQWVGKRPNGYVSFLYDITPYVQPGGGNTVAVKVDHSDDADSRWYTGSGLYREVHLVTADPLHLALWGVHYAATLGKGPSARLQAQARFQNETEQATTVQVKHELLDQDGNVVAVTETRQKVAPGAAAETSQTLKVARVKRWKLEAPYLYSLRTTLSAHGAVTDQSEVPVGFRSLTFDADRGFALNDEWMKIKGVCLHHDAGVLGAAVPREVWKARLLKLKEIGVNSIRMSHNPQATDLYDLCDELGMLVMDEAFDEWEYPKKKWIKGWNVGKPGFQGIAENFEAWGKQDLAAMVYRDRNHPSVILWSIGNEVDYPNDPYSHPILDSVGIGQQHTTGYLPDQPPAERLGTIAQELAAVVRSIDTTRPVTAALAGAVMSNETAYPAALDVVGYNYTESRYELDHQRYPKRVLYGSETRHDLQAWQAVKNHDFIFGQFIWTGFDYLGEAGPWPSRGFVTGMVSQANQIKPRGYFRQALWSDQPMVYVGTYPVPQRRKSYLSIDAPHLWNYPDDTLIRVVAYTNGDEAELLLNGTVVGARKPQDPQTAIIAWDIPFAPGTLSVVAYRAGKPIATDEVVTSGRPTRLVASREGDAPAHADDVVLVQVEVQDEAGRLASLADNRITCEVAGPGQLLGLESGTAFANENFNSNQLRCVDGKLLAYVRATGQQGTIQLTFTAPYLEKAVVTIPVGTAVR
ncbi:Glycosyl hydrolases family 2 [Catalinimonas alkaloidigena]|uniref:Glycosyl hydrolases family 2 n=1 Tax=Catalinimonas alkaloidigena TaxID=1075417 RepID=A0A1G9LM25_9BACT|nr:sugar-binding domain-containing protein [Catalinimonas alkaloidigena]SDL62893.1 Glycosyl hydrolases family 2 [Catalinimonas alkaloidigena]